MKKERCCQKLFRSKNEVKNRIINMETAKRFRRILVFRKAASNIRQF
jgi:hypothetical protein